MHDEPRQQLCKLIAQYGRSLSEDPRRCSALLKDHCGQYKREIFVLVNALENRIAEDLIKTSTGVPESILISRLSKRLEDELGLAEIVAKWAVETWALALGVIDQPMPVVAPTRVQPVLVASQSFSTPATLYSPPPPVQPVLVSSQNISTPATLYSPPTSKEGCLRFPNFCIGKINIFPKFRIGKINIGSKEKIAVGEIYIPSGKIIELKVSEDITDFSFLENCDPDGLLNVLNLSGCELGLNEDRESFWTNIKNIKNLFSLNLSGVHLSKLEYIGGLTNIQSLNLSMKNKIIGNIFIRDKELNYLRKLTKLKNLDLSNFKKITGVGILAALGQMTQLKSLNLSDCPNLNAARLRELKQMLPNTRILP